MIGAQAVDKAFDFDLVLEKVFHLNARGVDASVRLNLSANLHDHTVLQIAERDRLSMIIQNKGVGIGPENDAGNPNAVAKEGINRSGDLDLL